MPSPLQVQVENRVMTLTLDNPDNRNALSQAMVAALKDALDTADADPQVRAVVLRHTGGTFCAGADLVEAKERGMDAGSRDLLDLLNKIVHHRAPVIAALDGHVRAGGLGLVGACDIVLATDATTMAFTEARIGLAPAIISLVTSPRMTSRAVGRYYLTGEVLDAATAEQVGLITERTQDLDAALAALLDLLRQCSPQGLRESKAVAQQDLRISLADGGELMRARSAELFSSAEAKEGMEAFKQRRPPAWVS